MVRIAEAHQLQPIPLDIDLETLAPQTHLLERVISSRTRVVVVAHLFGTRIDLSAIAAQARRAGALVVEDSAQCFRGPGAGGDTLADVSLFSFGPIKTATALGGAVVEVKDPQLLQRMRAIEASWPRQSRWTYLRRVVRFAGLLALTNPRIYRILDRGLTRRAVTSIEWSLPRAWLPVRLAPADTPAPESRTARSRRAPTPTLRQRTARGADRTGEDVLGPLPPDVDRPRRRAIASATRSSPILVGDPARLRRRCGARVRQFVGHDEHRVPSSVRDAPARAVSRPRGVSAALSGDAGERASVARRGTRVRCRLRGRL